MVSADSRPTPSLEGVNKNRCGTPAGLTLKDNGAENVIWYACLLQISKFCDDSVINLPQDI